MHTEIQGASGMLGLGCKRVHCSVRAHASILTGVGLERMADAGVVPPG